MASSWGAGQGGRGLAGARPERTRRGRGVGGLTALLLPAPAAGPPASLPTWWGPAKCVVLSTTAMPSPAAAPSAKEQTSRKVKLNTKPPFQAPSLVERSMAPSSTTWGWWAGGGVGPGGLSGSSGSSSVSRGGAAAGAGGPGAAQQLPSRSAPAHRHGVVDDALPEDDGEQRRHAAGVQHLRGGGPPSEPVPRGRLPVAGKLTCACRHTRCPARTRRASPPRTAPAASRRCRWPQRWRPLRARPGEEGGDRVGAAQAGPAWPVRLVPAASRQKEQAPAPAA
jgi:hypothetical protein